MSTSREHITSGAEVKFPLGALVALCDLLDSRCWGYYDQERQEWVSFDFTVQLAALGWLPDGQFPDRPKASLWI